MKDEFTKYIVRWTWKNEIKERVFYDKNKAMNWKYLLENASDIEVKKITETIEIIA